MSYNLTAISSAQGLEGYSAAVNLQSGYLLFNCVLVVVFAMCFIAWRNKLSEARNVLASSAITSLFATLFLLQNLIVIDTAWIPYTMLILSYIYIRITEE